MSGLLDYDGLCGIIYPHAGDRQIRCHYKFAHDGPCSFAAKNADNEPGGCVRFVGFFWHPVEEYTQREKACLACRGQGCAMCRDTGER